MISNRDFEHNINVIAPARFVANKKENVMTVLTDLLVGACFKGVYILKIEEINKMSQCIIIPTNNNAHGSINVCFTASILTYKPGDVIPNVTVYTKEGHTFGKSQYATIAFMSKQINKSLVSGQIIPVLIGDTIKYHANSINIIGSLLMCDVETVMYNIEGAITLRDYENQVKPIIDEIESLDKAIHDNSVEFFSKLLYSYTKPKTAPKSIDLIKHIKSAAKTQVEMSGIWYRDLATKKEDYLISTVSKVADDVITLEVTTLTFVLTILQQCLSHRNALVDMAKTYTKEMIADNENIWTVIQRNKL
jgi:phage host-nuclease inhibitor protein Gam